MTATAAVIAAASDSGTCGARRSNVSDDACAGPELALSDAQLARLAVESLIEEAELTPKPALVDGRGSGAHRDLDLPTMRRSARALEACFEALARASRQRTPSATLRAELAQIGRGGEQAMMRATGGSNAHRGAIWIVGLMIAGAAISDVCGVAARAVSGAVDRALPSRAVSAVSAVSVSASARSTIAADAHASAPSLTNAAFADAARVCSLGAQIACFPDRVTAPADSNGERVRRRYQVGGARREAQDGFPHALDVGLPALVRAREQGIDENAARVDALLAIMASLDDTCLLHRAGLTGLQAGQRGARRVLAAGGSSTVGGRAAFAALDRALVALNASPGGAADLLAATLFLDKLSRQDFTGSTASWNT
ncbi:triphosphoribosyl-dephospho-CoA synthase [Paraburkholderia edwinii]|uniref:Probable 2-(5''-triphosphoribosyl)-3'-dephosphocoenzyme-A synthase n=1 Tax=Paraburkholderia edwinii TaxID=2861782 RepID=A0ABX8UR27_9BURK|nr:triphosphoribosyl-dephospho-CoA synthase [Paraburkholderia edwinii]